MQRKKDIYFILPILFIVYITSCSLNSLVMAINKNKVTEKGEEIYYKEVSNFTVTQISTTTQVSLTWTNPNDSDFAGVLILRKSENFATGYDDKNATIIYAGSLQNFTDTDLSNDKIYYYSIFCKNKENKYSYGKKKSVAIVSATNTASFSYKEVVTNFNSVLNDTSIYLSWINPTNDFSEVIIKRKIGEYPTSYNDGSAITIYSGSDTSYDDTNALVNNITYYYCIYAKNSSNVYSTFSAKSFKTFRTDFTPTVRKRCFYLIGGSSDYALPFTNLVSSIDAYDPVTDTIYANITSLPTPRYGCSVASFGGKIYVFGGLDSERQLVYDVDVLDINSPIWPTNIWSKAKNHPSPRYAGRSETVIDKIYVFGGSSGYYGETTSPSNFLNYATYFNSYENFRYDPATDNWVSDRKYVPFLYTSYFYMNLTSGVYDGQVFYCGERYNTAGTCANGAMACLHNFNSFIVRTVGAGTFVARTASAGVMYYKKASSGEDLIFFINCGGTTTNSTSEPIRNGIANLTAVNTCYMIRFPRSKGPSPLTWENVGNPTVRNLLTARAYAEAEYYGNYIYVFCGINNSGTVINSIEKLYVDDTLTFTSSGWTSTGIGTLSPRYAFDITKVNF